VARNIALVQREANVAMFNPDRFAATLETLAREGAARGLNRRFMEDLYRLIHEEALRHKTDTVEIKPFRRTP
jgi:chorismate mutase